MKDHQNLAKMERPSQTKCEFLEQQMNLMTLIEFNVYLCAFIGSGKYIDIFLKFTYNV